MDTEHLSTILEIISFLLVTTDLYGEKGLEKLNMGIKQFNKNNNKNLNTILSVSYAISVLLLLAWAICYCIYYYRKYARFYNTPNMIFIIIVAIVIIYVAIAYGLKILYFVIVIPLYLLFSGVIGMMQFILRYRTFKGLFALGGTLLFIYSKFLTWHHG